MIAQASWTLYSLTSAKGSISEDGLLSGRSGMPATLLWTPAPGKTLATTRHSQQPHSNDRRNPRGDLPGADSLAERGSNFLRQSSSSLICAAKRHPLIDFSVQAASALESYYAN